MNNLKNWIYKLVKSKMFDDNYLTPKYLLDRNWIEKDGYYIQPSIKDRDRVSIKFEDHCYRVWHSDKMTFIALESSVGWLELYMMCIDKYRNIDDLLQE